MDDLNKYKRVHNSKVHKENQQRPDFSMAEGSGFGVYADVLDAVSDVRLAAFKAML